MQINFKDFLIPEKMLGLVRGELSEAVKEANEWITKEKIEVLNIESIRDTFGGGNIGVTWREKGIRVWYKRI